MNRLWKQLALVGGLLLLLAGLPLLPGCCLITAVGTAADARAFGLVWLAVAAVTWGGGLLLVYHASHSLQKCPSASLRLPPLWALGWGLLLVLVAGEVLRRVSLGVVFFPPLFLLAATLPPLAAVTWVVNGQPEGLTWRQFTVAFLCGATVSVGLALLLEIVLPALVLTLVAGLFELVRDAWEALVNALAGGEVARALSSRGFLFAMIELAVVAPLAEEFAKPLIVLPLIRQARHPRQAFLIGAVAGAGFAALENLLYTGFGVNVWGGVLAVRALGAAVHPLGAGLVALGWYSVLRPDAGRIANPPHWLSRFGLAVGVHALWNGGIVLLVALVGANFCGPSPPEVDVLGVTLAGVLLALLAAVGAAAWVGMRAVTRVLGETPVEHVPATGPLAMDRAIAVWAVVCLIAALSIGLAVLRVFGGGG